MNILKMSFEHLFLFACDITDAIETILPDHLFADNAEIYAELESVLNMSLSHIKDVTSSATNKSLCDYITRRRYTMILQQISFEDFNKTRMNARNYGINKFKHKCLKKFPRLTESYCLEHMQPPIDKAHILYYLGKNIDKKGDEFLMKSLYNDIKANRIPFEIDDNCKSLVIQNSDTILIDLEKTYFIFRDYIFKISAIATACINDILPNIHFENDIYYERDFARNTNTNATVQSLHQFLYKNIRVTNGFFLTLEWSDKRRWCAKSLITSQSFKSNLLTDIKFSRDPFLIFDSQSVILDLTFLDRISAE